MIVIDNLRTRLDALASVDATLRSQAEIARRVGVSSSTMTQMCRGSERYQAGSVSKDTLEKLIALLIDVLERHKGKSISPKLAGELWTGSLASFRNIVAPWRGSVLDTVLDAVEPKLVVGVQFPPDGLGLIEDDDSVWESAIPIPQGQQYALTVKGPARGKLLILCRNHIGAWQFVAPSMLHSGKFHGTSRYPETPTDWRLFKQSEGLLDVFCIVHPTELVSGLPTSVPKATVIEKQTVDGFAAALAEGPWVGRWAWGKTTLKVERRPAPPQPDVTTGRKAERDGVDRAGANKKRVGNRKDGLS